MYLPASWQQQLINLPGGKLDGEVAIALTARHIDTTGFVLTDGQLSIDAEELENQKRNAYYYEKRKVEGGTLKISGDTVQGGGFMQAAQWALNADKVYSRSGEFIVTGADAAQTAERTAAFEAEIRAILGNNFTYETAQDNLKTEFKKDRRGWNLASWIKDTTVAQFAPTDRNIMKAIAAQPGQNYVDEQVQNSPALYAIGKTIVTMVATFFGGPYAGAGAAASWDQYYTYDATGDINASRRVGAKSFAVSMVSQYVGGQIDGAVANNTISATTGTALNIASQAAIQSAVYGTSFKDALINAMINEGSAAGAGYIGDGNFGPPGSVGHTLAHGVLGAMVESARGGDPLAGALGAMTATLVDQPLDEALGLNGNARQMALQAVSMIAGSIVASAAGRDALAGGNAALNATANNYLKHTDVEKLAAAVEECAPADTACRSYRAVFDMASDDNARRIQNCYAQNTCAQLYIDLMQGVVALAEAHDRLGDTYYQHYLAKAEADLAALFQAANGPSDGQRLAGEIMLGTAALGVAAITVPQAAVAGMAMLRSCATNLMLCANQASIFTAEAVAGDALPVGLGIGGGFFLRKLTGGSTPSAELVTKIAAYSPDELIAINGVSLFKHNNSNSADAVNGYLSLTRNANAPYMPGTMVRDVVMPPGETVFIIENKLAPSPGGWATQRIYTDLNEARQALGLLPEYKNLIEKQPINGVTQLDDIVIREYSVKQPLPTRQGIAGPQTTPDGELRYAGGGKQVEFLIDTRKETLDPLTRDPLWESFLEGRSEYRIGDPSQQAAPISRGSQP